MELQLSLTKRYTFADYIQWFDEKRRELFDGLIKMMSAPVVKHQNISFNLSGEFYLFYKKNKPKCSFFEAPFDVRLPKNGEKEDNKIYTVVQPDIVIICDKNKLDKRGCLGAPDFIAEIISPSTAKRDLDDKYKLYEKHGVREYWIIFPKEEIIQANFLKNGKYELSGIYTKGEEIPVQIFKQELTIELEKIFYSE